MFDFLLKGRNLPIALDIGSDSIKMLQLRQAGPSISIRACGRWRFPDGVTDALQRRQLAVDAVRSMLKTGDFKGKSVISTLGSHDVSIKNVRIPHLSGEELRQALTWEAKERFDFDVQDGQLSHLVAGEVRQGTETHDEVILLAVPQPAVDDYLSTLDDMGLRPMHIDAEPVALFRAYERFLRRREDEQSISVVVDIGLSSTRVIVGRGRQIVFLKNIEIGGRKLNEAVASHLNLTYSDAAELRMRIMRQQEEAKPSEKPRQPDAQSLEWTVYDSIRAQVEALSREIALCLRYCSVTFRGLRCNNVMLSGGEAYDSAVRDLLAKGLNIPVALSQPLRGIDVSGLDMGNRRGTLSEWTVCVGLAIRELDFTALRKEGEDGESKLSA